MDIAEYPTYRGLSPLAGLCPMERAAGPGLSVEACVARLKRYHYAFRRLHEIFVAHITAEPIYELKTAFAHHAYLCAEHATALRERVGEMREPPLGLEAVPDQSLEIFFDEIQAAPSTEDLVVGIYAGAVPALHAAVEEHLQATNPLADAPTVRILRFARMELLDMIRFGEGAHAGLLPDGNPDATARWLGTLREWLDAAGLLGGSAAPSGKTASRVYSTKPYAYDPVPRRDERFPDPYNMGVNAEAFLYDPGMPPDAKTLMLLYKRLREIDVPEMMASIIHQTKGKPWKYYRDMTRQLWDEARHAMMGEVGFAAADIDWPRLVPVNFNWSLALNTQLGPTERHAVLYFIEQGLMPRAGKRYEWEVAVAGENALAATFQDFDWADEVLHSRIGREWYVNTDFDGDAKRANAYGDACWNRVYLDWKSYREQGLTTHRSWWPDLYLEACRLHRKEPDDRALAFAETYEKTRADLRDVAGSG